MKFNQDVASILERKRGLNHLTKLRGVFKVEHIRKGETLNTYEFKNGVKDAGINHLLDVYFGATAKTAPWYIGLINTGASEAAGDTMASHAGWTEFTDYDEANRQEWDDAAAASKSKTSSTVATFTISASGTVYGILVANDNTKGGSSGILWSTGAFASEIPVADDDQIKVTYTISAS